LELSGFSIGHFGKLFLSESLANNEDVIGDGSTQGLSGFTGITPVPGSAFPALSGTPPVLSATNANCLALDATAGNIHNLRGFTIGDTGATGTDIHGSNFGTLNVAEITLNGSGRALNLSNGTLAGTFLGVTSTSGANNVLLTNIAGTSNLGSGSMSGATGTSFDVSGGTGVITYGGTIAQAAASQRPVSIAGKTGGSVTFNGAISSTTNGVSLTSNSGATISFTGGLTLSTGANSAFAATGGGTVSVTGSTNTLAATTGTALNVANTTIGASGLAFRSISANGAVNGIVLNNTGSSGGLTVSGTGSAGTGGTIQNTTGDGVSLSSVSNVSLSFVNIMNNLGNGIRGNNVTGFTLASSTIDNNDFDNNGSGADEAGLHFTNLLGSVSITNTTVSNHPEDNARIINSSGTLSQLTITNSTFRDTDTASPGNNGLLIQADGSANITADLTSSSYLRNRANGIQVINNGSGTLDVEIGTSGVAGSGGTFDDNNIGVNIAHNGSGSLLFDVHHATIDGLDDLTNGGSASPINLNLGSLGNTMSGSVTGNVLTNSDSSTGPGIRVTGNGAGTMTVLLQQNSISQVANRGIEVIARDGSNTINANIKNNTVTLTNALAADGIRVDTGATSTDTTTICADITGNTSTTIGGVFGIRVRQRFTSTIFRLEDYAGGATDDTAAASFLSTNNNGATASADHGGAGFATIAECPMP
jgi:hypothetical protein